MCQKGSILRYHNLQCEGSHVLIDLWCVGVIVLNKLSEPDSKDESPICVATIELKAVDSNAQPIIYSAYTYIDIDQSDRYIFPATTPLPAFEGTTPAGLLHYRRKELEILRVRMSCNGCHCRIAPISSDSAGKCLSCRL